jgi:hypothetical protein
LTPIAESPRLHWGDDATIPPPGWISDLPSGTIDQAELDAVLLGWGRTAAPSGATAVPEPGAGTLLAMGLLAIGIHWQRH